MSENQQCKRSEVPEALKWKLTDLYASDDLWEKEVDAIGSLSKQIADYAGKLGDSADTLLHFLKERDTLLQLMSRVYVYANQSYHQDTADAHYQAYAAKAESVRVEVSGSLSFADPEILAIPDKNKRRLYNNP